MMATFSRSRKAEAVKPTNLIHLNLNPPTIKSVVNKIPNWSRLGRLRRSAAPTFKGRLAERQAMTGRLVCDLKISAKELIRCKSYELASLAERLLGKSTMGALYFNYCKNYLS